MKFLCCLALLASTEIFASEKELPIGTFLGVSFSLEKNGVIILSEKDLHYHNSSLQIKKTSDHIYEFTISVYLQKTRDSKPISDLRVDKYTVLWKSETMGALLNENEEYKNVLSEFLLSDNKLTIKSLILSNELIETHSYSIR